MPVSRDDGWRNTWSLRPASCGVASSPWCGADHRERARRRGQLVQPIERVLEHRALPSRQQYCFGIRWPNRRCDVVRRAARPRRRRARASSRASGDRRRRPGRDAERTQRRSDSGDHHRTVAQCDVRAGGRNVRACTHERWRGHAAVTRRASTVRSHRTGPRASRARVAPAPAARDHSRPGFARPRRCSILWIDMRSIPAARAAAEMLPSCCASRREM